MNTVSLRRRVTVTAAVVSGVVLVAVALLVHALFGVVLHRSENAVLRDRVQLAKQLAQDGVSPQGLIERVDSRSTRARLVLSDGRVLGSLTRTAEEGAADTRRVELDGRGELAGARLTVQIDAPLLSRAQSRLGAMLLIATAGAIAVIVVALWIGLARALAPLDAMTRLARDIARGHRGQRLNPSRPGTELGRTAAAFDEMLDALEGALRTTAAAEARARASEQRIRTFVGDAAHELRTPVAGIRALAEAVVQQPADTDSAERERMVVLLAREARRAGRLVDDLLDLARIDAGLHLRRESVDLYDLAAAQLDGMRVLYPHVDFQLDGDHVTAQADAERLAQILVNLLTNACQAMTRNESDETDAAQVRVEVRRTATHDAVEATVTDTGPGVPQADRERIFDRLVRLDVARTDGSGLGLAIARGLARAHGGDLRCVEPPPDHPGASFALRLPINPPSPRDDTHSTQPPADGTKPDAAVRP